MATTAERLVEIRRGLDKMKNEKAQHEGALAMLNKRLKDEFNVDSIEEAETLLEKLDKELAEKEEKLKVCLADLETTYGNAV